ncbi:MAG TPA: hypothetical protein VME41_15665 [Stellaceae bacterium]|nr:hypothetical protein [Stellaceae bacterium]
MRSFLLLHLAHGPGNARKDPSHARLAEPGDQHLPRQVLLIDCEFKFADKWPKPDLECDGRRSVALFGAGNQRGPADRIRGTTTKRQNVKKITVICMKELDRHRASPLPPIAQVTNY